MTQHPGVFIRAPRIESVDSKSVSVLCRLPKHLSVNDIDDAVGVRQDNIMALAFHPELTSDLTWHTFFIKQVMLYKLGKTI